MERSERERGKLGCGFGGRSGNFPVVRTRWSSASSVDVDRCMSLTTVGALQNFAYFFFGRRFDLLLSCLSRWEGPRRMSRVDQSASAGVEARSKAMLSEYPCPKVYCGVGRKHQQQRMEGWSKNYSV